jgi:hypothetical protein
VNWEVEVQLDHIIFMQNIRFGGLVDDRSLLKASNLMFENNYMHDRQYEIVIPSPGPREINNCIYV